MTKETLGQMTARIFAPYCKQGFYSESHINRIMEGIKQQEKDGILRTVQHHYLPYKKDKKLGIYHNAVIVTAQTFENKGLILVIYEYLSAKKENGIKKWHPSKPGMRVIQDKDRLIKKICEIGLIGELQFFD